jgi:hypothetical protein
MEEWISLREFSRRRGVTLGAVQKAIDSGRVKAVRRSETTGRLVAIEYNQAIAEWNGNTDPDQAARAGQGPSAANARGPVAPGIPGTPVVQTIPAPGGEDSAAETGGVGGVLQPEQSASAAQDGDEHGYLGHRAKREEFQAKRAELDYLERVGLLVSVAEVRREQFDIFRQHRDKLEQISANISERLAAETDPQRCEHLLRTAIRNTLNELSSKLAIDAIAEGSAEGASIIA